MSQILSISRHSAAVPTPEDCAAEVAISRLLDGEDLDRSDARSLFTRIVEGYDVVELHKTAALYYCLALFIIGAQFLSVGLLGEMIAAYWTRDTDTYSIAEHTAPAAGTKSSISSPPTKAI